MTAPVMRLAVAGKLDDYLKAEARATRQAARQAVGAAARQARTATLRTVRSAGLAFGKRLSGQPFDKLVRAYVKRWPGSGVDASARLLSRATYRRRSGLVDLLSVFDDGAEIVGSRFLAIPTKDAPARPSGRGGARKAMPSELGLKLPIVRLRDGRFVLLNPARTAVWFVLVPRVSLKSRYDLAPIVEAAAKSLPARYARAMDRAVGRVQRRFEVLE